MPDARLRRTHTHAPCGPGRRPGVAAVERRAGDGDDPARGAPGGRHHRGGPPSAATLPALSCDEQEQFLEGRRDRGLGADREGHHQAVAADAPQGAAHPRRGLPVDRSREARRQLPRRPPRAPLQRLLRLQHRGLPAGPAPGLRRPRPGVDPRGSGRAWMARSPGGSTRSGTRTSGSRPASPRPTSSPGSGRSTSPAPSPRSSRTPTAISATSS